MNKAVKAILTFLVIIAITIVVLITAFFILMKYNDYLCEHVVLTEYVYEDENLPRVFDDFKILVIADLHNAPFFDDIKEHIDNTEPDVIVFAGDMVQLPGYSAEEAKKIAEYAKDKARIFSVSGNHETQNEEYRAIMSDIYHAGIVTMENNRNWIDRDGKILWIMGLKDIGTNEVNEETCEDAIDAIGYLKDEDYCVLVNHRADMYPYIKDCGVDLILSGHLHGGVVRLPFVGGLFDRGDESFFPEYDYGFFKDEGSSAMIVSGGCDKNPNKKRYFNPPEVVLVTLKAK